MNRTTIRTMASANIPAVASMFQEGVIARMGASGANAVCPTWDGLFMIRDEITGRKAGTNFSHDRHAGRVRHSPRWRVRPLEIQGCVMTIEYRFSVPGGPRRRWRHDRGRRHALRERGEYRRNVPRVRGRRSLRDHQRRHPKQDARPERTAGPDGRRRASLSRTAPSVYGFAPTYRSTGRTCGTK